MISSGPSSSRTKSPAKGSASPTKRSSIALSGRRSSRSRSASFFLSAPSMPATSTRPVTGCFGNVRGSRNTIKPTSRRRSSSFRYSERSIKNAGLGIKRPTLSASSCAGSPGRAGKPNAARQSARSRPSGRDSRSRHSGGSHGATGTVAPIVGSETRAATMRVHACAGIAGNAALRGRKRSYVASPRAKGS